MPLTLTPLPLPTSHLSSLPNLTCPSLTFTDFLNDFFREDKVPLWIWKWKNLRLVLMANRKFNFF